MEQAVRLQGGQRIVYKGDVANVSGRGAIVSIRENKLAGRMYSMNWSVGKLEPIDSSVSYDVILDDGREFSGVYSSNIGGEFHNKSCRFMLADGIADELELAELVGAAVIRKAGLKAKAEQVAAEFMAAKAKAEEAGAKLGLMPEAEFRKQGKRGSAAAYNIRHELKAAGIKARVKQDGYSAINVYVDPADLDRAKGIASKYKAGRFDGMTDCYDYDPSAWGSVFGDVQYVFCQPE